MFIIFKPHFICSLIQTLKLRRILVQNNQEEAVELLAANFTSTVHRSLKRMNIQETYIPQAYAWYVFSKHLESIQFKCIFNKINRLFQLFKAKSVARQFCGDSWFKKTWQNLRISANNLLISRGIFEFKQLLSLEYFKRIYHFCSNNMKRTGITKEWAQRRSLCA